MDNAEDLTITLFAECNELPDFNAIIDECVPLIVDDNGTATVLENGEVLPVDFDCFKAAVEAGKRFVCFDAVDVHRKLLKAAKASKKKQQIVWSLTDSYRLWDVGLLEQRIAWATSGRVIEFPDILSLCQQYGVPVDYQHESLRKLLQRQFRFLVDNLPYLKNDISGRHVFPTNNSSTKPTEWYAFELWTFAPIIHGWRKFGPACVGIDVQGAIAADVISQYQPHWECSAEEKTWRERYQSIVQAALRTPEFKECFDYSEPVDGCPRFNDRMTTAVEEIWKKLNGPRKRSNGRTIQERHRTFPRDQNGNLSLNPNHWDFSLPMTGAIRCWSDTSLAVQVDRCLTGKKNIPVETMPFCGSLVPDFFRRMFGRLPFSPKAGHDLIEIRFPDLTMLAYTLASVVLFDKTAYHLSNSLTVEDTGLIVVEADDAENAERPPMSDRTFTPLNYRETWISLMLSDPYCFSGGELRSERLFPVIASGVLFPEMLQETGIFDESVYQRLRNQTAEVASRWRQSMKNEATNAESVFEPYLSTIPDWLRKDDFYRRLANFVTDCIVDEHPTTDILAACAERFVASVGKKHEAKLLRLVENMIDWLSVRSINKQYDNTYFPLVFYGKYGRGKKFTWDMNDISVIVRQEETQESIRNAVSGRDGTFKRWKTNIVPLIPTESGESGLPDKPGQEAHEFFYMTNTLSLTGKPGRPIDATERSSSMVREITDDLLKATLYRLVREGIIVVTFDRESVVLELPKNDSSKDRCKSLIDKSIRSVLDSCRDYCDMPFLPLKRLDSCLAFVDKK